MEKQKCPELRFNGFSEDWEQSNFLYNIQSIIDFRGRTPKKLGMDWSKDGYLALSALNVKNGYIDPKIDAHYGDEKLYQKWMAGNELKKGQVLFTTEAPMGNVAQVPDDRGYILSQRTIAFNVKANKISDDFLAVLLGSPNVFNTLSGLSSGGTAKGVSQKSLSGLEVIFAKDLAEQEQIGQFFQNLDQSIALHKKKLAQTQNFKKVSLEKMFPKQGIQRPEIRLKGFSGDWEERQLKDISVKVLEKNSEHLYSETFTNSAQFGVISQRDFFDKDISNTSNIGGYYVVKDNDFIYNPRISYFAPVGPVKRNKLGRTGVVSPLYFVFRTHDVDHKFLETYFETSVWHKFMFLNGDTGARSDRLAIKDTIFMEMPIYSPSFEEQQKIGQFFKQLDDAINLQKQQLQTVKNLKQALLEKMFV